MESVRDISRLELAGEPVDFGGVGERTWASNPRLARMPAGDAGVVFVERIRPPPDECHDSPALRQDAIASRALVGAFGAWPPALGESVEHALPKHGPGFLQELASQSDGTFVWRGAQSWVGRLGSPGTSIESWERMFLDEADGGAGFAAAWDRDASGWRLRRHDAGRFDAAPRDVVLVQHVLHEPSGPTGAEPCVMGLPGGGAVVALSPNLSVYHPGKIELELFHVSASGAVERSGAREAAFRGQKTLLPRARGAWLTFTTYGSGIVIHRVDAAGRFEGEPWVRPPAFEHAPMPVVAPLRDGLVVAEWGPKGLELVLYDEGGEVSSSLLLAHTPIAERFAGQKGRGGGIKRTSLLVNQEETKILIAHDTETSVRVVRADV